MVFSTSDIPILLLSSVQLQLVPPSVKIGQWFHTPFFSDECFPQIWQTDLHLKGGRDLILTFSHPKLIHFLINRTLRKKVKYSNIDSYNSQALRIQLIPKNSESALKGF